MLSKSDKEVSNKGKRMSDVYFAQTMFREAFPQRRYGSVKAALQEEARREQIELRTRLASLDEKIAAFEAAAHREALARPFSEMGR